MDVKPEVGPSLSPPGLLQQGSSPGRGLPTRTEGDTVLTQLTQAPPGAALSQTPKSRFVGRSWFQKGVFPVLIRELQATNDRKS